MDSTSSSVVRSERNSSSSASPANFDGPISLTYAFMSVALQNDVYFFRETDIRDSRIYLGEGAASSVYKSSVEPSHGRVKPQIVAIKQKRRRGSWFNHDVSLESWLRAAYLDLRVMSHLSLEGSRNVATALGYFWEKVEMDGRTGLSPCIVLPLAADDAPTLDHFFKMLRRDGYQAVIREKVELCRGVANGLAELHHAGVVHGDLKLGNVLMFKDPARRGLLTPKISDFSHSFVMSDFTRDCQRPRYTGTRPFTIPEIRRQESLNHSLDTHGPSKEPEAIVDPENFHLCDIFSLGLLMSTILNDGLDLATRIMTRTRERGYQIGEEISDVMVELLLDEMFQRPQFALMESRDSLRRSHVFRTPTGLNRELATSVDQSLRICLQDNPDDRGSAADVVASLDKWLGAEPQEERPRDASSRGLHYDERIPRPYGSLYEFLAIMSAYSVPQFSTLIQSQIYHEALQNSKPASRQSEMFLAACYALGLGTPVNTLKAAEYLEKAAYLSDGMAQGILDRVSKATGFQTPLRLRFMANDSPPCLEYSDRIRQTKTLFSEQGDFVGMTLRRRPGIPHGFHPPGASNSEILRFALDDDDTVDEEVRRQRIRRARSFEFKSNGCDDDILSRFDLQSMMDKSIQEMRGLGSVDNTLSEAFGALTFLDQALTSKGVTPQGGLFHLAVNFIGSDSSLATQFRTLQLIKAVEASQAAKDIDRINEFGETPLLKACENGNSLAVQYLVSLGASVSSTDRRGIMPLHWLGFFADDEAERVARLLVKAGAPINATTTGILNLPEHCFNLQPGCTPLHYAVAMRNLSAVRVLLDLGADPSAEAEISLAFHGYGFTPLHFAICLHFHEIVEMLLQVPGASSDVMFKRYDKATKGPISIVHLIGVHLFMPSDMSPFARWILHGDKYEEAAEKTLEAIFAIFPERRVLVPTRHALSCLALPVQDPWIWRVMKKVGVGLKKLTPEEMGLRPEEAIHQGPNYEVELWTRTALDASHLNKSSGVMMEIALSNYSEDEIRLEGSFFLQLIETCATADMSGPLAALLSWSHLRDQARPVMPFFFWLAAGSDAVEVMRVIWDLFVETSKEENPEIVNEYLSFTWKNMSPLHRAADSNCVFTARYLLEKGADKDLDLGKNGTPLYRAARSFNSRECAVFLLEMGSSLFCCKDNGEGYTVLHAASADPDLLLKGDQEFSMVRTIFESNPSKFLGGPEEIMNSVDRFGHTALYTAVQNCDVRTIQLFLEIGRTDLSLKSGLGETPLMTALRRQTFGQEYADGFIEWLQERGYENISPNYGDSSWMKERFGTIVKMLTEAGSPLPEVEETTGEYKFLIRYAAKQVFLHVDDENLGEKVSSLFGNLDFMKRPSRRTGSAAMITMTPDRGTIMIFPHGLYAGADMLKYSRE